MSSWGEADLDQFYKTRQQNIDLYLSRKRAKHMKKYTKSYKKNVMKRLGLTNYHKKSHKKSFGRRRRSRR